MKNNPQNKSGSVKRRKVLSSESSQLYLNLELNFLQLDPVSFYGPGLHKNRNGAILKVPLKYFKVPGTIHFQQSLFLDLLHKNRNGKGISGAVGLIIGWWQPHIEFAKSCPTTKYGSLNFVQFRIWTIFLQHFAFVWWIHLKVFPRTNWEKSRLLQVLFDFV